MATTTSKRRKSSAVDAKEPFAFTVTSYDAKGSVVGDPFHCAGACALTKLDGVVGAKVMRSTTTLEFTDGKKVRYRNPKRVQDAVEKFDNTAGLFPPGEYVLTPFTKSQRLDSMTKKRHDSNFTDGSRPNQSRKKPIWAIR